MLLVLNVRNLSDENLIEQWAENLRVNKLPENTDYALVVSVGTTVQEKNIPYPTQLTIMDTHF